MGDMDEIRGWEIRQWLLAVGFDVPASVIAEWDDARADAVHEWAGREYFYRTDRGYPNTAAVPAEIASHRAPAPGAVAAKV